MASAVLEREPFATPEAKAKVANAYKVEGPNVKPNPDNWKKILHPTEALFNMKNEPKPGENPVIFTYETKKDPNSKMKAATWKGAKTIVAEDRPMPLISDPRDAIVQITTTTVCGSDLHMFFDELSPYGAMQKGDIMGHEAVGVVTQVGPECKAVKKGDRVAISAVIACGACEFCRKGCTSLCDNTNPSQVMKTLYGDRLAGVFGYSHLVGGYDGIQAEYARVPLADVNLLKLPDEVSDEKAIFLSDVMCTGWHGNVLGETGPGKNVAVWGAGPVGAMAAYLAKKRGADRVLLIDSTHYRLKLVESLNLGIECIDYKECNILEEIRRRLPLGPDTCIDCTGFRFPKSIMHKVMRATKLEGDACDVPTEAITACKKGGIVVLIADYFTNTNNFPIGMMMEKALTVRGGQLFCHTYWEHLLSLIQQGELDPSWEVSHDWDFENIGQGYQVFSQQEDNALKMVFRTKAYKGPRLSEEELKRKRDSLNAPLTGTAQMKKEQSESKEKRNLDLAGQEEANKRQRSAASDESAPREAMSKNKVASEKEHSLPQAQ